MRLRDEHGQSTIEFAGTMVWLVLAALFAWQLALVGWTMVSAGDAARTAARMESRGGDGKTAGEQAVSGMLHSDVNVVMNGDQAQVTVGIPLVFPGLQKVLPPITETATMPPTG